jgi:hypothetical protein
LRILQKAALQVWRMGELRTPATACGEREGTPQQIARAAMPSYRYCFLDSADRVAEFHVIACESDSQAQTRADRLLAACGYPSIVVWDRGRTVYCARKGDAALVPE